MFSLGVALVVLSPHPSHVLLVVMVLLVGAGSAMFGPAYSAILPGLVGKEDLPGAISLNSAQMNASRVIGPVIGGVLYSAIGPAWVFAGNAATYLFVVAALMMVTLPAVPQIARHASRWRELTAGITVARQDKVIGRCLVTVFVFSLLALAFIGQMPVVAAHNLGIDLSKSADYGILYACFGAGALTGAISIGTVFAQTSKPLARAGLPRRLRGVAVRLRAAALAHPRRRQCRRDGRLLLRVHHRAEHDPPVAPARERARPRHGAVDDGLRGHRRHRQPADRAGRGSRRASPTSCSSASVVALALAWYADVRTPPEVQVVLGAELAQ